MNGTFTSDKTEYIIVYLYNQTINKISFKNISEEININNPGL